MGNAGAATVSSDSYASLCVWLWLSPACLHVDRSAVFFDPHRWSPSPTVTKTTLLVPSIVDTEAAAESAAPALVLASGALDLFMDEHVWNATIPLHTRLVRPRRGSASYLSIDLQLPQVFLYCRGRHFFAPIAAGRPMYDRSVCPPLSWIGSEWRAACAQAEIRAATAAPDAGRWVRVPPRFLGATQTISIQLPVGKLEDAAWVGVATASAVVAVALAFGFTVVRASRAFQRSSQQNERGAGSKF
jgi:hypothetical protein